jgi:cysteinyl-tRNA synthetase
LLLQTHYRQPLDFTKSGIAEARRTLDRWYRLIEGGADSKALVPEGITAALSDDLNTPLAIAELHKLAGADAGAFRAGANLLGLLQHDPDDWFKWQPPKTTIDVDGLNDAAIDALITERTQARANKDFAASDRIRDELAEQGIILEDSAGGTTWRRG